MVMPGTSQESQMDSDQNSVVTEVEEEYEEAVESPFDNGGSQKRRLIPDLNVAVKEEWGEVVFDNGGSDPMMKQLVLDLNDVVMEDGEEERRPPFIDGGAEKKCWCPLFKNNDGAVNYSGLEFRLELTREEIEEDFIKMTGRPPPRRRPRRKPRPTFVHNQLDRLVPGLRLTNVTLTPDLYNVPELPLHESQERNKRNRNGESKKY